MELNIKRINNEWVKITPDDSDVFSKEDVRSHFEFAGIDIDELEWEIGEQGLEWYCKCCGKLVGYLKF